MLGPVITVSERAILAQYYRHTIWLPKSLCAIYGNQLWAKTFAIRSAIADNEEREKRSQEAEDQSYTEAKDFW